MTYIYVNTKPLKLNLTIMTRYDEIKQMVADLEDDFDKFYEKSNKAAGLRVRKGMQALKVKAQSIREEVQEIKNS